MGKDFCVTVPTGKIKAKTPEELLEEQLKRHFSGIISAMVKWSKTVDKTKTNNESEHEGDIPPSDQIAVESTTSLEGNTE